LTLDLRFSDNRNRLRICFVLVRGLSNVLTRQVHSELMCRTPPPPPDSVCLPSPGPISI
jgi:hypothetical protein